MTALRKVGGGAAAVIAAGPQRCCWLIPQIASCLYLLANKRRALVLLAAVADAGRLPAQVRALWEAQAALVQAVT